MALADRLAAPRKSPVHGCGVGYILTTLPTAEADALNQMLGDPAWSGADIARELEREGYTRSNRERIIQRHRKGDCACRSLTA